MKQYGEISEYMLYFNTGAQMAFMAPESGGKHAGLQAARTVLPGSKDSIEPYIKMVVLL
jgi:hypothetical protein